MTRSNTMVTVFGGLAVLGGIPEAVTRAGIKMPLVWNSITPWLSLCGIVFTALAFWAAKGASEHSTAEQVQAASLKKQVDGLAKQADEDPKPATEVTIVPPLSEVLHDPQSAEAEILRLRAALNIKPAASVDEKPSSSKA